MSVRVNDLLKLPSLREATVLSGKNQLDTSVASLSFLEVLIVCGLQVFFTNRGFRLFV